ncbi:hypothetical protein PAXRUDRAFT_165296, partial [Paxillus rubicundulus Ve08.2h10]
EIMTNCCSCLGANKFRKLQIMKHTWHGCIEDHTALNSMEIDEVSMEEFKELLVHDGEMAELDNLNDDSSDVIML